MLLNKLKKITGIIRVRILKPDFNLKLFNPEYVYMGCLCVNTSTNKNTNTLENFIFTNYIPGVIEANFITYKEKAIKFGKEEINWENTTKLKLKKMSKQWDYICFEFSNVSDFISFPKINKIIDKSCSFSDNINEYNIYGLSSVSKTINTNIKIIKSEKMNLIHDKLPSQIYFLCEQNDAYSGSVIYTVVENIGNYKLEILGITSNDYCNTGRIIPLSHFNYNDTFINISLDKYIFSIEDIFNIPIINNKSYPILTSNYSNLLKKNDIIIKINNLHISNMNLYNYKLNNYQTIDEYFTYISQFNPNCRFILIRNKQIIEVEININIFKIKIHNDIYLDINDLYVDKQKCRSSSNLVEEQKCKSSSNFFEEQNIKFSTDISDYILENEIYNKDIMKYIDDFSYKISEIKLD